LLITLDTLAAETPAAFAMSLIVGIRCLCFLSNSILIVSVF
jgi:hypothetical protein